MSQRKNRYTQIDFGTICNKVTAKGTQQNILYGLNKDGVENSSHSTDMATSHNDDVFATKKPLLPQPIRPLLFPIKAYGSLKLKSPWSTYEKICNLRFGADYHVILAQQTVSPHQQVFIRHFPGVFDKEKLQILQQVRNTNFVAVLDAFRFEDITYVVFENLHISLHEMERSRKRIKTLHLPAILGPVCS